MKRCKTTIALDVGRDSGARIREQVGSMGRSEYINLTAGDMERLLDRIARLEASVRSLQNQRTDGLGGAEFPPWLLEQMFGNALCVSGGQGRE